MWFILIVAAFAFIACDGSNPAKAPIKEPTNSQPVVDTDPQLNSQPVVDTDPQPWKLYWTDMRTEKIQRSNLDGSGVEDLVTTGLRAPDGIALDVSGGKMYWTDYIRNKIQRSNLDGSEVEDLVTTGSGRPDGIALDVSGGKMYWTMRIPNRAHGKIQRSNLDGSEVEDLVTTGLGRPDGIALDVSGGKMYWTDTLGTRPNKIRRSNLDGSEVEDLVTTGLEEPLGGPSGIALDVSGGKMYWADTGTRPDNKIRRSNLDGSEVEDLVTGLGSPDGIALDVSGGKMYWADGTGLADGKIQRSNLDGSEVEDLVTGLRNPSGIALGLLPIEIEAGPDLIIQALVRFRLEPGQSFTLSVTVRNQGTEQAAATTLRYYRSDDATIDSTDTPLGTATVNSLASLAERAYSIDLTAPASTGEYYYGACVESVAGERKTHNNCNGRRVDVSRPSPPTPECYDGMKLAIGESCKTLSGGELTCYHAQGCIVEVSQ